MINSNLLVVCFFNKNWVKFDHIDILTCRAFLLPNMPNMYTAEESSMPYTPDGISVCRQPGYTADWPRGRPLMFCEWGWGRRKSRKQISRALLWEIIFKRHSLGKKIFYLFVVLGKKQIHLSPVPPPDH